MTNGIKRFQRRFRGFHGIMQSFVKSLKPLCNPYNPGFIKEQGSLEWYQGCFRSFKEILGALYETIRGLMKRRREFGKKGAVHWISEGILGSFGGFLTVFKGFQGCIVYFGGFHGVSGLAMGFRGVTRSLMAVFGRFREIDSLKAVPQGFGGFLVSFQ